MEVQVDSKKITKLLLMKGDERLDAKDEVTAGIHSAINKLKENNSFLKVDFIESKVKESQHSGTWIEYNLLLSLPKSENHIKYLNLEFMELSKFLNLLKDNIDFDSVSSNIESFGIEEVETGRPNFYYFLFYILKNNGDWK